MRTSSELSVPMPVSVHTAISRLVDVSHNDDGLYPRPQRRPRLCLHRLLARCSIPVSSKLQVYPTRPREPGPV